MQVGELLEDPETIEADEERRAREEVTEFWDEHLVNSLKEFEDDLKNLNQKPNPVDHYWIGKIADQLYVRYFERRFSFDDLESQGPLSTSALEARNRLDAVWERVKPLMNQYIEYGKVPDRLQAVPRRGAEEQRRMREPTNEQAESAG
jgi:hypothetical protein